MMMFDREGAELFAGCLGEAECITVEDALADLPRDRAGVRIGSAPALRLMLSSEGALGAIAARLLGPPARPVRAIFFDKTAVTNWG